MLISSVDCQTYRQVRNYLSELIHSGTKEISSIVINTTKEDTFFVVVSYRIIRDRTDETNFPYVGQIPFGETNLIINVRYRYCKDDPDMIEFFYKSRLYTNYCKNLIH